MLLTFLYMIATVMQARTISFLKAHLRAIFKGNQSCSTIMLYTKPSQYLDEDYNGMKSPIENGYEENENFMTSHLCLNKSLAKLGELLWYQGDVKLCSIYPEQQIDISSWLDYPYGDSLFPLYIANCCQILSAPDVRMHILVEADIETYRPQQITTIATKLEDYGLIVTWIANRNMNFIMETDIDRVTSFMIAVMQGQRYINNGLLLTRIQSVLVSGKPCTYDSKQLDPSPDKKLVEEVQWNAYVQKLRALSDTAQIASQHNKPVEVAKLPGLNVYPQNRDPNTEISIDSGRVIENDDGKAISGFSIPATSPLTPATAVPAKPDVESAVISVDINITSKKTSVATYSSENSNNLAKTQLSDVTKKKDNILLDASNEKSAKSICQSKSAGETRNLKTAFTRSGLREGEIDRKIVKPPNVVIYADSPDAINNVKTVLQNALDRNRYVIYALSREEARSNAWVDQVALVVICGNVDLEIGTQLVEYIIHGGKLLALCSDMLHTLLPSFKTAEVRENELVHFSYGKWKHVRMMHHIFCYHASPVRNRFSQDHEDIRMPSLNPPASTSVKDKRGKLHSFDVKVLGTEETWHNPSILLANLASSGGKVVFSQIHLEIDPTQYEYEEDKYNALKESNAARLEIISDLLSTHLGMEINHASEASMVYTPAYFLGTFEMKVKFLERLKDNMQANDVLKMPKLDIRFYTASTITQSASASFLPIMVHMCPANFSTVQYFENLITKELGRLVIYVDVLTSSMNIIENRLGHGLAVIPRQQTQGQGRGRNIWLSPMGCAMFTIQIHISTSSLLGSHVSILQHIAAVALVSAVRSIPGYEDIDLGLKWPNDVYVGSLTKIGGLMVSTQIDASLCICNIGAGINLSNSKPTSSINDAILNYNQKYGTKLQTFSYEQYLALVFNELEILLDIVQSGNTQHFFKLYYKYWLHMDSNVTIAKSTGKSESVTIRGIDDFGFLLVQGNGGTMFSVHPDGNSFDLLKGLILPK